MVFAMVMIALKSIEHLSLPNLIRLINKPHNAIIVGYSQSAKELKHFLENDPWSNYRFLGYFTEKEKRNEPIIGNLTEIKSFLEKEKVDDVFLLLNHIPKDLQKEVANITKNQSTHIHLVPELSSFAMMNVSYTEFGHQPVLNVERGPLSKFHNQLLKRAVDIVISSIVILALLTWIIPILWLINKLKYRQGAFFLQARNGSNNQQFRCIKFRSMFDNPLADKKEAGKLDDRITPLGRFLRKTSLDELPQFINVFKGEMSVVGPRPHMLRHTSLYRKTLKEFMVRHTVKPGLTGLAQVSGFRGSIFNEKHLRNRVKMDIKYIETWTLWMDIKIMLLTMFTILKGDKNAF
jgi:exopolysaccharide biosynthesis polyprenyl glycosylphosphotransferase